MLWRCKYCDTLFFTLGDWRSHLWTAHKVVVTEKAARPRCAARRRTGC